MNEQLLLLEEKSAEQSEALVNLHQVLQDFQKNQSKDIASATERERRKYQQEVDKGFKLESTIEQLKVNK